jgi:hypothetical protein
VLCSKPCALQNEDKSFTQGTAYVYPVLVRFVAKGGGPAQQQQRLEIQVADIKGGSCVLGCALACLRAEEARAVLLVLLLDTANAPRRAHAQRRQHTHTHKHTHTHTHTRNESRHTGQQRSVNKPLLAIATHSSGRHVLRFASQEDREAVSLAITAAQAAAGGGGDAGGADGGGSTAPAAAAAAVAAAGGPGSNQAAVQLAQQLSPAARQQLLATNA